MKRRMISIVAAAVGSLALAPVHADWPEKPVRVLVPTGPGSSPDIFARILAGTLGDALGQPFLVENKLGAGGNIAIDLVAKAAPNGYTIAVAHPAPLTTNTMMYSNMPYDPLRDLTLVTNAVMQPTVLVVGMGLGVNNVRELVALLKKDPGKYNSASVGAASLGRLAAEMLAKQSGANITNVAVAGAPQILAGMVNGDYHMSILPAVGVMPFAKAGKVKMLALAEPRRSSILPDIPTLREQGIPNVEAGNWLGVVGPAKMDGALVKKIRDDVIRALNAPETRKRLTENYMEVVASTPEEFAATIEADDARWKPIIEQFKIKVE